jgi:serine/threonine-protein kinase RsbW
VTKAFHELKCMTRPSSIAVVHDFVDRYLSSLDPDRLSDVHIIADELASNIEKYAYGTDTGPYLVRLGMDDRCLEMDFEDAGKEFDPTLIMEVPADGHDHRPVGGLGILLVKKLADKIRYSRCAGKNITTVTMHIPGKYLQKGD